METVLLSATPVVRSPFWYVKKTEKGYEGVAIQMTDQRKELVLNTVGAMMLYYCDGQKTIGDIIALIAGKYPAERRAQVETDVFAFFSRLAETKVLDMDFDPLRYPAEIPRNYFY